MSEKESDIRFEDARRLEDIEEANKEHSYWWGSQDVLVTKEDIEHLKNGGILFFDDGEYSHAIHYKE